MVIEVNNKIELENVINNNADKYVIVDFYAEWCSPCHTMGDMLETIQAERDDVIVAKVNVDILGNLELAQEYKVRTIPNIFFYKNSELLRTLLGSTSREFVDSILTD